MKTKDKIKEYINKNRNWTIRKIQKELNLSSPSLVHYHLKKMKTEKVGKCSGNNKDILFNIIICILKGIIYNEYENFKIQSYPNSIQIKFEGKRDLKDMSWGERSCKNSLSHTGEVCKYNPTFATCNVDCEGYEWDGKTEKDSECCKEDNGP